MVIQLTPSGYEYGPFFLNVAFIACERTQRGDIAYHHHGEEANSGGVGSDAGEQCACLYLHQHSAATAEELGSGCNANAARPRRQQHDHRRGKRVNLEHGSLSARIRKDTNATGEG